MTWVLADALRPVTASTGTPWWVTVGVAVVTAAISAGFTLLLKRTAGAPTLGDRENALINQLQEENNKLSERVDKLEDRVGKQAQRELQFYAYITQVHAHFAAGNPPPPPPIPQELFGTLGSV